MNTNRINATLAQENVDAILAAVAKIQELLPFLIDLTPDERRSMAKFGEKNRSFVVKAEALASQHPEILPRGFSLDEMKSDVRLVEQLYPVQMALNDLLGRVEDSYYAAGSEAYCAALQVYNYAKAAHVATGALEGALGDLGRRFARRGHASEKVDAENVAA